MRAGGLAVILPLLLAGGGPLAGQSLASRVASAPDGTVRLSYSAKSGVCGNGRNIQTTRARNREWEPDCEPGPVRVAVDVSAGQPVAVRAYIGGRWSDEAAAVTDLGRVPAPEAAVWFLDLAERGPEVKGDPVLAAVLADSVETWPALLRIARTQARRKEVRRQAIFWLGQEAADAATRGLEELAGDDTEERELRRQAVFALSQLGEGRGVDALIRVAGEDRDPAIRKQALFWLAQSEDPRALTLFERLLSGGQSRP